MDNQFESVKRTFYVKKRFKNRNIKKLNVNNLQMIYVVSKLKGDIEANIEKAKKYCKFVHDKGLMPVASHIMYPAIGFNDEVEEEREKCRLYGLYLLAVCDALYCFVENDEISDGMRAEIEVAKKLNIPIKYFRVLEDEIYEYTGSRCN